LGGYRFPEVVVCYLAPLRMAALFTVKDDFFRFPFGQTESFLQVAAGGVVGRSFQNAANIENYWLNVQKIYKLWVIGY
jgi:hypothetical protein